jgi:hypothetical protein
LCQSPRREHAQSTEPQPGPSEPVKAGGGTARRSRNVVDDLEGQRRKLLRLFYDDRIGADLFAEEEARLAATNEAAQRESEAARADVARFFDEVAALLSSLDVECITVLPDYLDLEVQGAPPVHFLYQEVGLKESQFERVGGGLDTMP